ncbi:MAG TPA: diacylglycerol kinase family protein [Streptosporangiaceae bacterium]|nr:diacylglycerol kinase family protein [Streptosporangiaceae bacterium]
MQRWLARLAFAALIAAVAVLVAAGVLRSITALLIGLAGLALSCAAAWWVVAHRGPVRWLAAAGLVVAPAGVITLYVLAGLLWEIALSTALTGAGLLAGRKALLAGRGPDRSSGRARPPEVAADPPHRPFLIMNPRSGGGKVGRFGLAEGAAGRGAQVALLTGPGLVDVGALARQAVDRGADLLGVAGGDGTQALVAGIAAGRDIPMLVISAGTRNHFALDLGLDRDDPAAGLDALGGDGVEVRIDLGEIAGRTFVNNASFGAYAQVVQSPAYRDDKAGTALEMLPGLLSGTDGPHLTVRVDGQVILDGPQAVLVSNNPYETDDIAGLGRRARLDTGQLGVVAVHVQGAAQAAALLRPSGRRGSLTALTACEVVVDSDRPQIPVGIDGEALMLPAPVRCTIAPLALRVRVPAGRPGVPVPSPRLTWARLAHLALSRKTRGRHRARRHPSG